MPRLPTPGSDDGQWGGILNGYLSVEHNSDGTLKKATDITAAKDTAQAAQQTATDAQTELDAHTSDTTNIHGITDTSKLAMRSSDSVNTGKAIDAYTGSPLAVVSGPSNVRNSLTGWWHVDGYGAIGDGVTNDRSAIQAAIDACSAAGGGRVYFPKRTFLIGSSLTPKSGVSIVSDGAQITTTSNIPAINATTTSFTDFTLDGLVFVGTVTETPSAPKRARATSGAGMTVAVQLSGDLDVNNPGNASMTNFTMRNCAVRNCSSLPILIRGVRGVVRVINSEFTNNMDAGFTFNQEVIFTNNHVQMSADNGVSISRGNTKITCTGNTFENCCYWGIWVSGFNTDVGPTNFTVAGNTIKEVGYGGIQADSAASYGVIVGNAIDGGYHRGPSDAPTDSWGTGVYIGSYPSASSSPTTFSQNVLVAHNQIRRMPRAGVLLNATKSTKVSGNLIADIGTQYLADGSTAIASSDQNNNVGILVLNATAAANLTFDTNTMIDERTTPYMNYSILPIVAPTTSNYWGNTHQGLRNTYNLQEQTATGAGSRTFRDVISFSSNTKHVGGATAGSNAGSGTIGGFDVNGIATSTRLNRWKTAGSDRWAFGVNATAEGGSNTGSDIELRSYDDSGSLLVTPITVERASGKITFAKPWGYGFPYSVDPGAIRSGDSMAVPASNTAIFLRVREGGTISKIGLSVATQSGNISVAAYANSGSGRSAVPGTRLATSGSVACPATGYSEITLDSTVTLYPGDWLCLSCDNTTAKFVTLLSTGADNNLGLGRQLREATAHPAPSTPASLVATIGYDLVLIGV